MRRAVLMLVLCTVAAGATPGAAPAAIDERDLVSRADGAGG